MLFHTAFIPKEVDEVLLSGFTGAISAIADQLGDSIRQIRMENQTFWLHQFEPYILILSTSPELSKSYVRNRLEKLEGSASLRIMAEEDSMEELIEANNELHLEIADLFELDFSEEEDIFEEELDEIEDDELFNQVLKELENLEDIEL